MKSSQALSIAALAIFAACQPIPTEPKADALRPALSATAGPGAMGSGGTTAGPGTFGSGGVTGTSIQSGSTTTTDSTQVTGRGPGGFGSGG